MKILMYIFFGLALGLFIFNLFHVDFNSPLAGDSYAASAGTIASLCAMVLILILNLALKVQRKIKDYSKDS